MIVVTDWLPYRHGVYRRVGDRMECYTNFKTLPHGFYAEEDAYVTESLDEKYKYFISVKIKGWTNNVRE